MYYTRCTLLKMILNKYRCVAFSVQQSSQIMCPESLLPQESLVTGSFDLQDILFYGGCGFSIMRCMSFVLENCEKKDGNYTFSDLLKYNFYLPFFFFGPVMTFDRYHAQVRS